MKHALKHLQKYPKRVMHIPLTSNATSYHHGLPLSPPAEYDIWMLEKQQARKILFSIQTQSNSSDT
jgi:hypothetical protein